jgi:hypothetical protein
MDKNCFNFCISDRPKGWTNKLSLEECYDYCSDPKQRNSMVVEYFDGFIQNDNYKYLILFIFAIILIYFLYFHNNN